MEKRPWPILILALLHALSPLASAVLACFRLHFGVWTYFSYLHTYPTWTLLEYFALFPLAGFAIYKMKPWSYPVCLAVLGWSFWRTAHDLMPIGWTLIVYSINLSVMSYFLIPEVRRSYFDSRLKWWERKPRYQVSIPAHLEIISPLSSDAKLEFVVVADLSRGGAFLKQCTPIPIGQARYRLRCEIAGRPFIFVGRPAHTGTASRPGIGFEFDRLGFANDIRVAQLILALRLIGAPRQNPIRMRSPVVFFKEGILWTSRLLKTGQGLLPPTFAQAVPTPCSPVRPDAESPVEAA